MTLRMITDKVLTSQASPHFTTDDVNRLKTAKFNIVCQRWGIDDASGSEDAAVRCQSAGVLWAPWTQFIVNTTTDAEKFTSSGGTQTAIASPTSDTLWTHIGGHLTTYAEMASRVSSVWGIFGDLEPYQSQFDDPLNLPLVRDDDALMAYAYSYSDDEITQFCSESSITCPDPIPDDRGAWLDGEGEHDNYKAWIKAEVTSKWESAIDTVLTYVSDFRVGIWCASDNYFIRACLDAFSNKGLSQPVTILPNYGASDRVLMADMQYLYQNEAAEKTTWNGRGATAPIGVIPYIHPKYRGPYGMAQAARMGLKATDGYWVWFAGEDAETRTQEYLDALTVINKTHHWSDDIITEW